jgi:hypothetical protein
MALPPPPPPPPPAVERRRRRRRQGHELTGHDATVAIHGPVALRGADGRDIGGFRQGRGGQGRGQRRAQHGGRECGIFEVMAYLVEDHAGAVHGVVLRVIAEAHVIQWDRGHGEVL